MNKNTISSLFTAGAVIVLLSLSGCASQPPSEAKGSDSRRLTALETEVGSLRVEAKAREAALREELASIRENLAAVRDLIKVEQARAKGLTPVDPDAEAKAESETMNRELDKKAKNFVSENLDRLLDITGKLLDKMEKEIDEKMQKKAPEPDGDQI